MQNLLIAAAILANLFAPVSREEAAKGDAISVTGVVTCVAYWQKSSCVIASPDDPNGDAIYVSGEHPERPHVTALEGGPLAIGDLVAAEGVRTPMFFAPGVKALSIRKIGAMTLPQPPEYRLADFAGGRLDNRRVAISGVVREVKEFTPSTSAVRLFTRDGFLELRVKSPAKEMIALVDSEITATGVAMSRFNQRAEFLGVRLEVADIADIAVVKPRTGDPFLAPLVEIPSLLSWSPEGYDGHSRRIRGVVTSVQDRMVTLQNGRNAIRVAMVTAAVPALGAAVEVIGFPELSDGVGIMRGATSRDLTDGIPRPEPVALELKKLDEIEVFGQNAYFDYDSLLVTVEGRLSRARGGELTLADGGHDVRVVAQGSVSDEVAKYLDYSPPVRLVGVAGIKFDWSFAEGRRVGVSEVTLFTRTSEDFTLVRTPDLEGAILVGYVRLAVYAVTVAALVAAIVFGLALLRHRRERREARILAEDRRRMAVDLHDTIEQHLAGAKILLTTALKIPGGMKGEAESAVTVAADVLMEAKRQIRDVIMNLRNDELMKKPLEELLKSVAESVNRQGATRVRTVLRELPGNLSAGAKTDLVAIVQQAITNAVKHGRAKNVAIVADPGVLRIANDGSPFDAATALGPDAGHFGLSSMRERAKRSGFGFSIGVEGKWTVVRITI